MFNFLKQKELATIELLEDEVKFLEKELDKLRSSYNFMVKTFDSEVESLKKELKSKAIIKCRNTKCLDYENGKCSLSNIIINEYGKCEDFGEDDINMMSELSKEAIYGYGFNVAPTIIVTEN